MIRRREVITLLGGAAAAWPVTARAQQRERMRRIGVFVSLAADDPLAQTRNAAFLQELARLGWEVGRNLQIDYRWGGGDPSRYANYAAELVAPGPEAILAAGGGLVGPLQQASRTVPIVFLLVTDPVSSGYVASLSRPGGSATGFTQWEFSISAKWIELLKEVAPSVKRVAALYEPARPAGSAKSAQCSRGTLTGDRDQPAERKRCARYRPGDHAIC